MMNLYLLKTITLWVVVVYFGVKFFETLFSINRTPKTRFIKTQQGILMVTRSPWDILLGKPIKDIQIEVFTKMVVDWCQSNLPRKTQRKIYPRIMNNNHPTGKILGSYCFSSKTITIYPRRHPSLDQLIDTIIHEYVHHLQLRRNEDDKRYDVLLKKMGHEKHPMEIEAKVTAEKYKKQCIKELGFNIPSRIKL